MKKILFFFIILILINLLSKSKKIQAQEKKYFVGQIIEVNIKKNNNQPSEIIYSVKTDDNQIIKINHTFEKNFHYKKIDKVIVSKSNNQFFIEDYFRLDKIIILLAIFLTTTFFIIGKKTFGVIFSIFFSLFILFTSVIPNIIAGYDPIIAAIFGCFIIIPFSFFFSHGFNKKTLIAILGTLISLILTGIISYLSSIFLKITGTAAEEIIFFKVIINQEVNFFSIYIASIIITLTGILDDVTVTEVSIVWELKKSLKNTSWFKIYNKALTIGKDHLKSIINTIIIVYVGTNLPLILFLYLSKNQILTYLNFEIFAQEIVCFLISTLGLLLSMPITTLIAVKSNY